MTVDNEEYHITLEWRSEESSSSSEDETPAPPREPPSKLGAESSPSNAPSLDATMTESASTLPTQRSSQPSASAQTSSATPDTSSPSQSLPEFPMPEGSVSPRGYQLELYQRACEENIIAFLDTGSGKTLVAALLVRKTLEDLRAEEESTETSPESSEPSPADSNVSTDVEMTSDEVPPNASFNEQLPQKRSRDDSRDKLVLVAPKPLPRKARKIAVFLVHRVPLVPQQASAVISVLPTEDLVGAYYGEQGVDDWSSSKWAKSLRTKSVLVMTAQIFLNLLRHGLIDIRDVALLIVDEVHHATKSHPYRRIFVEFYHTIKDGDPRPRVFGMTATPVKKKSSYYDQTPYLTALAELEATLDATIVAVSDKGQSEVETLVPKPEEFIVTYKSQELNLVTEEYGEEELERENAILTRLAEQDTSTSEEQQASPEDTTMSDRLPGPEMEHERATDEQQAEDDNNAAKNESLLPDEMELVKRISSKLGNKAAVDFATKLCRLADKNPDITLQAILEGRSAEDLHENIITEHVSKLLDILCAEYLRTKGEREEPNNTPRRAERFQCIVFVQERLSALSLTWLINSVFTPLECIELNARSVVGAQNSDSVVRMSRANLNKTINEFREGKYGILVSTSVVEEGLDIPACSLVVAFDPVLSPTSYIQARGRARKKGARYVAFVQEGIAGSYEGLYHIRKGAKIMTDVAKRGIRVEVSRQMEQIKNLKGIAGKEKMLFSRTTGARVSATESLNLLNRYCYMKGGNTDWETYKPTYSFSECDGGIIATVTLHPSIPLDCGLSAEPHETELLAKRHAALDAYSKLYQIGEVDAYLLPRRNSRSQRVLRMTKKYRHDLSIRAFTHRTKQRSKREVPSKASKKNRRVRVCKVAHPDVLRSTEVKEGSSDVKMTRESNGDEVLYLYQVSLDCDMHGHEWYPSRKHEAFGILVRDLIPIEDQKVIQCPQGDSLFTLSFVKEVSLSAELEGIVYKYVRFLQLCLRGRTPGSEAALDIEKSEYENTGKVGFFLVPLRLDALSRKRDIDWSDMRRLHTFGWRCGPAEEHESRENRVLEHMMLCSQHENLDRVYLSGSRRPDLRADMHPRGFLNSAYRTFGHYFQKKHGTILNDPRQVLLEGFSVREAICNLSVSAFMLPEETCRVIPVSPLACFITSILPMWQTFLALRTCWRRNRIAESPVDFLTFARALQPNINNVAKKEADLSYERLEFLGDAVLKVIYSMVTFVKHPDNNEGLLSDERDLEVSNQRLADLALEMQLQDCVAFSGVSQKVRSWPWYWGTHQNESIRISEKVLADCVEALIGAQYIHGGVDLATVFMDKHKLLPEACKFLGIRQWNGTGGGPGGPNEGVFVGVPPMGPGDKRHASDAIAEVEKKIGYEFEDKRHLVVALTHGSFENGLISSYQRYEYLGDAIIGFLLLSHYFKKYPDLSPGELTSLRGPALSNDLFARVIVSCGLQRTFWHNCAPLQKEINKFAELFANEESDDEDVSKTITVPKVLGDLLESIIGAIVVDKGMRLDGVQEIVLRIMHEELSRFANPDKFKHNPVSQLVRLVQQTSSTRPKYDYLEDSDGMEKTCIISVNGDEVGRGMGPTRRVAKRKASIAALENIGRENGNTDGCAGSNLLFLRTRNTLSVANES